jgi:GNAT superfamily N-acetyltransferase
VGTSDRGSAADLALASERLLRPGVAPLRGGEAAGAGEVLLVRAAAVRLAGGALDLVPCTTDADWARYAGARVAVEAGFGLDEAAARAMVARTRERGARIGLRLWTAPGPVAAVAAFPVPGDPATARLQEVDVFPGYRGAGRGDALLEAVRRLLAAEGVARLVVGADEDDWPLSWYLRRGFRAVARVPVASPSEG